MACAPWPLPLQPALACALLAVLPTSVRHLTLDVPCRDPLFLLLRRFPQLESITISGREGNGAELSWHSHAGAAIIPKVASLLLNLRGEPEWDGSLYQYADIETVPATWLPAMAAAARLNSLELRAAWSDEVAKLCAALPALEDLRCGWLPTSAERSLMRDMGVCAWPSLWHCFKSMIRTRPPACLPAYVHAWHYTALISSPRPLQQCCSLAASRLTLYSCTNEEGVEAVHAMAALPAARPRSLGLTVHSAQPGTDENPIGQPDIEEWYDWAYLPPMAQLAGRLTALTLSGAVRCV